MRIFGEGVVSGANTLRRALHPTGTMSLHAAELLAFALQAYGLAGLLFAVPFLAVGAARVDPHLTASPRAVRVLILPGVATFWPLLAWRWLAGEQAPVERNPHRSAAAARGART
jgi:hypothetical protein